MSGSLMERRHFLNPLRSIFDDDVNDWFVGFDKMMEDMAKRWDHVFEGFTDEMSTEIKKTDDRHYRVIMKVPGYAKDEIKVQRIEDELVVKGHHEMKGDKEKAGREMDFEQRFFLAKDIHVDAAKLEKDELCIDVSFPEPAPRNVEEIMLT